MKKTTKKAASKKVAVGAKVTKKKPEITAKDLKNLHQMIDSVAAKDGSGFVIVLDTKQNDGSSFARKVTSSEVAACILAAIEGHTDEVMPILIKMFALNKIGR